MQPEETVVSRLLYSGFWEGKAPCWRMLRCPRAIRDVCPAFKHPELPCWEIEGTYAKLVKRGKIVEGRSTEVCAVCRVHRRWGNDQPVSIRLFGQGINSHPVALDRLREDSEVS